MQQTCNLTFQSLAVSLRTTRFNFQKFYMVHALSWMFCTDIRTNAIPPCFSTDLVLNFLLSWLLLLLPSTFYTFTTFFWKPLQRRDLLWCCRSVSNPAGQLVTHLQYICGAEEGISQRYLLLLRPAKLRPQHKLHTPFLPLSEQNPPFSLTRGEAPYHVTLFWHAMR
jgi:hypothetical protein